MLTWWKGTRLVAGRAVLETIRSRTFKVVTGLLLVLSAAAVVVPQLLGQGATTYTLGTVGKAPADLSAALTGAGKAADVKIRFVSRRDTEAIRRAVRDGDATAGLVGDTLYASADAGGTFPVLVTQTVVALETSRRLASAGLSAQQVADIQSVRAPKQVQVGRVDDAGRAGIGFAVGILLYLALIFAGTAIATTVATEKSTRICEVLLAVLRPSQLLVGTVLAIGSVTLAQLLVLAAPLAVAVQFTDTIGLPAVAGGDIALAVAWFALGFVLYAFAYAATAALVDKVTEVNSAIMPVTLVLVLAYVLGVAVVMPNPGSGLSAFVSIFPITAPLAMPIRWASGEVPIYQLLLAMVLTAATSGLLAWLGASVYQRALLVTGRRLRLRDAISGAGPHA